MVIIFCLLLILGIVGGQVLDFSKIYEILSLITSICLAYIMIEVGLEFSVEKRKIGSYGWDAVVAVIAAVLPALLCFSYFVLFIHSTWKSALLSGLSAAPTSAGVLFSMMMAAGLSATWVFKKARVLAVLDDLATILLLTPLQIFITGFEWSSIAVLVLIAMFLFASFRWQSTLSWPVGENWLLFYAAVITGILFFIKHATHVHLEVLIPAFMLGCLIHMPHHHQKPVQRTMVGLDTIIKGLFMFLVGLSLPKIALGSVSLGATIGHVVILTILANLGKSFSLLCYRKEASFRERLALSVAMFPRGEVGAAVLLIGIGYGFTGYENTLAVLSLACNLILTGTFIWIVMRFLQRKDIAVNNRN
ncbi:MAG: cation:proton antiporter [Candidatus Omnitrophica bacterium]|nr:cation:proton antiporter [Candidatus Omnitrophota bacterium]